MNKSHVRRLFWLGLMFFMKTQREREEKIRRDMVWSQRALIKGRKSVLNNIIMKKITKFSILLQNG